MRFFTDSFQTVCIPAKNFTFFAEVADGKFLRYRFLEETDPAAALLSAKAAGFSGKTIVLAATFSDFRVKLASFPDMPEDELASTLQWEQDALFSMPEPEMRTHILSHSPDGYRKRRSPAGKTPRETRGNESHTSAPSFLRKLSPRPAPFSFAETLRRVCFTGMRTAR